MQTKYYEVWWCTEDIPFDPESTRWHMEEEYWKPDTLEEVMEELQSWSFLAGDFVVIREVICTPSIVLHAPAKEVCPNAE